jgi:hypothetical protein
LKGAVYGSRRAWRGGGAGPPTAQDEAEPLAVQGEVEPPAVLGEGEPLVTEMRAGAAISRRPARDATVFSRGGSDSVCCDQIQFDTGSKGRGSK